MYLCQEHNNPERGNQMIIFRILDVEYDPDHSLKLNTPHLSNKICQSRNIIILAHPFNIIVISVDKVAKLIALSNSACC